jgi:hypothetical protein
VLLSSQHGLVEQNPGLVAKVRPKHVDICG